MTLARPSGRDALQKLQDPLLNALLGEFLGGVAALLSILLTPARVVPLFVVRLQNHLGPALFAETSRERLPQLFVSRL
jgi:hypothetical protein